MAIPFRLVGLKPSRMNPNTCTFCELAFTKIMRARNITIDATVFFADLRGYTTFAERTSPTEVVAMLNRYFDVSTRVITAEGGTIVQYIGDALMAMFNAPTHQADHALRAVRAALAMQRGIDVVRRG